MPERAAGAFRIFSGFVWYSGITKIARAAAACAAAPSGGICMNRIRSRLRRWPPSWLCCWRWQGVPPLLQPRSRERPPKRSTPRENTPRRRSPPRWTAASLPPSYRCWTAFPRYRCIMTPKTPQRRFPGRGDGWETIDPSTVQAFLDGLDKTQVETLTACYGGSGRWWWPPPRPAAR